MTVIFSLTFQSRLNLKTFLKPQLSFKFRSHVIHNGKLVHTYPFAFPFSIATLSENLKVGYLYIKFETYIPNPMICNRCQRYGHTEPNVEVGSASVPNAENMAVTPNLNEAQTTPNVNCSGDHISFSSFYPVWKIEKIVLTIKHTDNIFL